MNIENTNPTVSCSILRPRKAALEAETMVLCRRNDRFQEKLLFYLRKTTFLELEGTLGRPNGQVEDQRGATSKKEASKRQKATCTDLGTPQVGSRSDSGPIWSSFGEQVWNNI